MNTVQIYVWQYFQIQLQRKIFFRVWRDYLRRCFGRCRDPSELGSYCSALLCTGCGGLVLPADPLGKMILWVNYILKVHSREILNPFFWHKLTSGMPNGRLCQLFLSIFHTVRSKCAFYALCVVRVGAKWECPLSGQRGVSPHIVWGSAEWECPLSRAAFSVCHAMSWSTTKIFLKHFQYKICTHKKC